MVPSKSSYNVKKEEPSSLHQAQSTTETHPNLANSLSMKSEPSKSAGSTTDNQLAMDIDKKPVLPDDPISSLPAASKSFPVEKGESSKILLKQRQVASASLRSMKFKKNMPRVTPQAGDTIRGSDIVQNREETRIKKESDPNRDQIIVKKEPEIKDDDEVMKEPEREDNRSEFVEMSREQSIIWTQAAEANRAGDEATANRLYQRLGELDSVRTRPIRPLPADSIDPPTPIALHPPQTLENRIHKLVKASRSQQIFGPYFHKKIRTLTSPLPLTIFNPKWQTKALRYDEKRREFDSDLYQEEEEEPFNYYGYPYPDELKLNFITWTSNHRNLYTTLKDKYKYTIFAEWMHKHKLNCDAINAESGFMVALRYDITVRANCFAYRVQLKDGRESVSDISILREDIKESSYRKSERFDELFLIDNPYLSGGSRYGLNPITGNPLDPDDHPQEARPHNSNNRSRKRQLTTTTTGTPRSTGNPRYKGRAYDPDFVDPRNTLNRNNTSASGSGSHS
ncbi:hypothetical protein KEM48_000752 [Puccinia striiformis f. sp. tritici PST-130]|uniref:Uncharacterized protein n=1 Tax=Puccinia striiformis f. sp. tritici PST-78 TaxID=1165861 RepID=A0A0L0URQ1_9BASI|nr:hypothetical protein KEM48_000987 [Puccinia striiformis f. sp. tritici PST-130]KAI9604439.1 hypothetical protein KEM48_000752 [Puccinia striiformis f. sp. tritici PST-130]KNE89767.1 hypothetical protein PSTG_16761 [Puccinia striiformis f. sp. tritici PST-78]